MGIRNTGGINNNGKAFFFYIKTYYFFIFAQVVNNSCIPPSKHNFLTKIQIQIFFSQTQLKQQHKARLFSLQLLTYCSTIRCQFFSHFLMVIEQFILFIALCCLNNWFKVLSTRVTLLQSLVSQLIGTIKQSIKCS